MPSPVEIHNVLTVAQGGVLTIGLVLAIYFASNGVESLRVGLNRAYSVVEMRQLVLAAAGIDRLHAARGGRPAVARVPDRAGAADDRDRPALLSDRDGGQRAVHHLRAASASPSLSLIVALFIVHKWLPAGNRGGCATSFPASC